MKQRIKYQRFGKHIIKEVLEMKRSGKTNRQIAGHFNLELEQIRNLIKRYKRAQKQPPQPIGRPRKQPLTQIEAAELKIRQLEAENDILRNFLSTYERGDA